MAVVRVHRVPHSTNVERVALAAGIKGVAIEWVDHAEADRSAVRALSGQDLVPVAEFGGEVVVDSIAILRRLEAESPEPPLWPAEPAARARAEIFISWFNEVWKLAPNALAADPAGVAAEEKAEAIATSVELFAGLLHASPYLAGAAAGIEDVCAYPFLRYHLDQPRPGDTDPFHAVLHAHLGSRPSPLLAAWVERMRALPQA